MRLVQERLEGKRLDARGIQEKDRFGLPVYGSSRSITLLKTSGFAR